MAAPGTDRIPGEAWAEWTEEVRLAMGWNGGVSLAVWMGGVAVELDAARRARPPVPVTEARDDPPRVLGPARSTTALYAALLAAFDRLLVVDILAGASAGGLNGALLAGAMMHDRPLTASFLRDRWISIGDFSTLLQPLSNKNPASLMQGAQFFQQLREAFIELLGSNGPPTNAGCDGRHPVFLDIQVTDVLGKQHCFTDDWNQPFYASEYRAPARFRHFDDYTAGTLAAAARASASFPAAFEPQMLTGKAAALVGFPGKIRWAIDGGLLENAPIKPAIELIPRVPTALPVKRYVCYVNAAPTAYEQDDDTPPGQPTLAKVLSYTINLPREGRVIDQLFALDDATRLAGATADAGVRLLSLDRAVLRQTAAGLLPTYQNRRALLSLTELLGSVLSDGQPSGGPGRARQAIAGLAPLVLETEIADAQPAALLPWIPTSVDPPVSPEEWRWGVRVAQRVLQLELDALRAALVAMTRDDEVVVEPIIDALGQIARGLQSLDAVYADFVDPAGASAQAAQRLLCEDLDERRRALSDLTNLARGIGTVVFGYLRPATDVFWDAYNHLSGKTLARARLPSAADLFRSEAPEGAWPDPERLTVFLGRALAIETIRRSFSDDFDIDSAQPLHVAQLTPLIPTPLFDRGGSDNASGGEVAGQARRLGPITAKDKLAGLRLNHFAGFYRSSWRENDFMWGRLDGAAAVTRLLVDSERASTLNMLERDPGLEPWSQLATALVPGDDDGDGERLRLIIELLDSEGEREGLGTEPTPSPDRVRSVLTNALRRDLIGGDGTFAWAACTRALQYEILREEAPHLLEQARVDKDAGAYRTKLDWETGTGVWSAIQQLRDGGAGERYESLPERLGCDDRDEATSTLALRTISQTMLVGLAAVAGALPLTRFLQPVRLPLLAVAGSTARRALDRIAVALGFAGAAWYLAARWLTTPGPPAKGTQAGLIQKAADVPLKAVWSPQVIVLWLAILAVLGVASVPGLRAIRTPSKKRRTWETAVAATFLACGGAVALAWQWDLRGTIEALTTWHSTYRPPDQLLWAVAAAAGVQAASSLDTVLRFAGPILKRFGKWVSLTSLIFGGVGVTLAVYSAKHGLYPAIRHGGFKTLCALLALAGPVAVASYVSVGPAVLQSLQRLFRLAQGARHAAVNKAAAIKQWLQRRIHWPWRRM